MYCVMRTSAPSVYRRYDTCTPIIATLPHISDSTLAMAVAVPVGVIVIVLITIIVVITGVYLIKRRRYRHYQLHRMTMSQVDDEEGDC